MSGERKIGCWRQRIVLNEPEAKDVLGRLKLRGVQIKLDGESLTNVIKAIETFLNRYQKSFWYLVTAEITGAIRRELLKSRNPINVKLVTEVVEHLEKEKKEFKQKEALRVEEEEDSGSEEEEESESDSDDSEDDDDEGKTEVAAAKETDDLKDPTRRRECIEVLIYLAGKKGMSVNKEDEEAILEMMKPYLRGSLLYSNRIEIFLNRVREHIDRCSTLDSLETVETALQSPVFSKAYEGYKVKVQTTREEDMADASKDHLSKKNLVPTKEEGFATPMNQITQEEIRVCGDRMEIEEKETLMIPLNLPEQPKESMGNAYSCIKESLERAGSNKRKLGQV